MIVILGCTKCNHINSNIIITKWGIYEQNHAQYSRTRFFSLLPYQIKIKPLWDLFLFGAGTGSRTLILSLGRIHNSRYTIPATVSIISHLYKYVIIILCKIYVKNYNLQ